MIIKDLMQYSTKFIKFEHVLPTSKHISSGGHFTAKKPQIQTWFSVTKAFSSFDNLAKRLSIFYLTHDIPQCTYQKEEIK